MHYSIFLVLSILILSCSANHIDQEEKYNRILFIVSNAHYYGDSEIEATNHFQEIILPYDEFVINGYAVDILSPYGGSIPIGYIHNSDSLTKKFLYDEDFMNQLEYTLKPGDIDPEDYLAVYYGGGGSAMFTVPESRAIQDISSQVYEQNGGIVSAVCHGTAGLAELKLSDGSYLVEGKKVNGFPDIFENKDAPYYQEFPFSIEEMIESRGGEFVYSDEGWDGFFIEDGRLITGQDPSAARIVAQRVIKKLEILD